MKGRGSQFAFVMIVFVLLAIYGLEPITNVSGAALSLNLAWYLLAWHVAVLAHECAHAAAARGVGLRPFSIDVGYGPPLVQTVFAGLMLVVRPLPGGGLTRLTAHSARWFRWRLLACLAAGPICNAALAGACLFLAPNQVRVVTDELKSRALPVAMFFVANAFMAMNAFPFPGRVKRSPGETAGSDGWQILTLAAKGDAQIRGLVEASDLVDAQMACLQRQWAVARSACKRVLVRSPDSVGAKLFLAAAELGDRDYATARDLYVALLDEPKVASALSHIQNNLAWTYFMLADPRSMEEAAKLCEQAIRAAPRSKAFLHTYGAILLELGRVDEAVDLLRRRVGGNRHSRATKECLLALAEGRLGRVAWARNHVRSAERLDANCELLPRARGACAAEGIL